MAREPFVPVELDACAATTSRPTVLAAAADASAEQVGRAVGERRRGSGARLQLHVPGLPRPRRQPRARRARRLGRADAAEAARERRLGRGRRGAASSLRCPAARLWHCTWLLLRGLMDFRERARLYFDDAIHELELPVPYRHARARDASRDQRAPAAPARARARVRRRPLPGRAASTSTTASPRGAVPDAARAGAPRHGGAARAVSRLHREHEERLRCRLRRPPRTRARGSCSSER